MRHVRSSFVVPTFLIEAFILLAAIQYRLTASDVQSNSVQSLYEPLPKMLTLMRFMDRDVFDMTHHAQIPEAGNTKGA